MDKAPVTPLGFKINTDPDRLVNDMDLLYNIETKEWEKPAPLECGRRSERYYWHAVII